MTPQYIHDTKGKTTGVFIPISDWNKLKKKYVNLEEKETEFEMLDWQKEIIDERLANYEKNPNITISFKELITRVKKSR